MGWPVWCIPLLLARANAGLRGRFACRPIEARCARAGLPSAPQARLPLGTRPKAREPPGRGQHPAPAADRPAQDFHANPAYHPVSPSRPDLFISAWSPRRFIRCGPAPGGGASAARSAAPLSAQATQGGTVGVGPGPSAGPQRIKRRAAIRPASHTGLMLRCVAGFLLVL